MKQSIKTIISLAAIIMLTGCSTQQENQVPSSTITPSASAETPIQDDNQKDDEKSTITELVVHFGDEGEAFTMYLYDNDTAQAIAQYVNSQEWRLPIVNYDNYENWEIMQYYDIPSRYEIPSNPEKITEATSGSVYYSEPNRIILYYGEGEVSAEYTPVGYFEQSEEFESAVRENPVVEGWSNKIVRIGLQ